jgi:hypothetical protein
MSVVRNLDSSIVYVDVNLNSSGTDGPTPLSKQLTFSNPVVSRAGDYYVACARCVFPGQSIWMWAPELELGQVDSPPLQTAYSVTLTQGEFTSGRVYMQLVRSDISLPAPPVPLTSQPITSYAAVYDVSTIVTMVNTALATAFTYLADAGAAIPAGATAPYWTYSADSETFTMTCNQFAAYEDDSANPISIYFSANFLAYLSGWPIVVLNDMPSMSASTGGKDIRIACKNSGANWLDYVAGPPATWLPPPGTSANPFVPRDENTALLQIAQSWTNLWAFQAMQTIQVIATGIPAVLEVTSPPVPMGGGVGGVTAVGGGAGAYILQDFAANPTVAGGFSQPLVYTPGSIIPGARYVSMVGDSPLYSFGITLRWTDSVGYSHPLESLTTQTPASIKLVFVHKSLLAGTAAGERTADGVTEILARSGLGASRGPPGARR